MPPIDLSSSWTELGRGTSTFDGMAIAQAVIEYIHNRIGARTLFFDSLP